MQIAMLARGLQKTVVDNSPAILTAIGVAGTVSTAVLSAKAHGTASVDILKYEEELHVVVTPRERFDLTWKLYIPAVATGTATIACIIGANTISTKRQAALATAFSLSEVAFKEYKDKVVEQIGANKEQAVVDSIAQDRVAANPVSSNQVLVASGGNVLCYESMSGRYFRSDVETIRKAENDINRQILTDMYASQNEFNVLIGLPPTSYGEEVGWTIDKKLEIQLSAVLSEDGKPCLCIGYLWTPVRDYHKIGG